MKTIKDILKSDSIEQRRRIAKTLAISKEDKNALIVNESNGGCGNGSSRIEYWRIKDFDMGGNEMYFSSIKCYDTKNRIRIIGPYIYYLANQNQTMYSNPIAVSFVPIATEFGEFKIINSLKDLMSIMGVSEEEFNTLFEPITEEEFYNIKPE